MRKKLLGLGFLAALGEGIYISLIALLMTNLEKVFGNGPNILGIITLLALLVLSAAISGALILGKPILLYLDGKKGEAVELFIFTLCWLFIFVIAVLASIVIMN